MPNMHLHLVPRVRTNEFISSLPTCLNNMHRDNFTFIHSWVHLPHQFSYTLMTAFFFLHLFISASSISVHTALNYGNICEQSSGKGGLNLRNCPGILLKGLRKPRNPCHSTWLSGWDFKWDLLNRWNSNKPSVMFGAWPIDCTTSNILRLGNYYPERRTLSVN